ncbi:hypothetical protein D3C81_11390 [compost metagenome]
MGKFIVVAEGGETLLKYLNKNNVYPDEVFFSVSRFKERSAYFSKEDTVLIIVHGLTDLTVKDIYEVINTLLENRGTEDIEDAGDITLMSNMDLGRLKIPYYLYYGDLFFGNIKQVEKEKVVESVENFELSSLKKVVDVKNISAKIKEAKLPSKLFAKKTKQEDTFYTKSNENSTINGVMLRFKKYNSKQVKVLVHKKEPLVVDPSFMKDEGLNFVVQVDLFN